MKKIKKFGKYSIVSAGWIAFIVLASLAFGGVALLITSMLGLKSILFGIVLSAIFTFAIGATFQKELSISFNKIEEWAEQ